MGCELFLATYFPADNEASINGDEINGNGNSAGRFEGLCLEVEVQSQLDPVAPGNKIK